jgi:hypothetical protein
VHHPIVAHSRDRRAAGVAARRGGGACLSLLR